MEKIFDNLFSKDIIKNIKSFIPSKTEYCCLYCGHIYQNKDIKFNDPNNCICYRTFYSFAWRRGAKASSSHCKA